MGNNTFGFLLVGAGRAKPEAFGNAGEDRSKTEEMKPTIAFVAEEELFGYFPRPAFFAAGVDVVSTASLFLCCCRQRERRGLWSLGSSAKGGFDGCWSHEREKERKENTRARWEEI